MKIFAYDENMNKIGEIKYIQLLWDRKNFESGSFVLYQQSQHYIEAAYIRAEGRREIGIVYKPAYSNAMNGRYRTVEGKFAEDLANGATTHHGRNIVASQSLNKQLMEELKSQSIIESSSSEELDRRDDVLTRCMESGAEIYRILQLDQETFRIDWDNGWKISFVKPKNRGLHFSKGLGNVKDIAFLKDMSLYKHKCTGYVEIPKDIVDSGYTGTTCVGGKYYETGSYTSTLDVPDIYKRREISVDLSIPEGLEITVANKSKIKEQIVQMCKLELLDHYVIREIELTPAQADGCKYLEDYDLGDIIEVEIPEINVVYKAQIIEVNETWEKNMQKYKIVLGHKKLQR